MPNTEVWTTVTVLKTQFEEADKKVKKRGYRSVSELVRDLLRRWLEENSD